MCAHSHCSSLSSPTLPPTLWPPLSLPTLTPSLTSEHVLSSLSLHHACTVPWHSVREEEGVRWEEGKQRKQEGEGKIRKKRRERRRKDKGRRKKKGEERSGGWRDSRVHVKTFSHDAVVSPHTSHLFWLTWRRWNWWRRVLESVSCESVRVWVCSACVHVVEKKQRFSPSSHHTTATVVNGSAHTLLRKQVVLCITQLLLMVGLKYTLWCIYRKFPKNMSPSSECLLPFSTPCSCVNEHLLGVFLWAFSSPVIICVQNTYTLNTCTIALFAGHHQDFRCLYQERKLTQGGFLSPLTMQIADLSWRNTRAPVPLISCSTHSSKLLSWLSTPSIDCEEQRKQCMHRTNRIFEQTPSPIFASKKCAEKDLRRIFVSLWYIYMLSLTDLNGYGGDNFPTYRHTQINVCIRTYWKHSVRLRVLASPRSMFCAMPLTLAVAVFLSFTV